MAMNDDANRRAELIGAALAGELTPQEQAELDEMGRRDPSVLTELAELNALRGQLRASALTWVDAEPGPGLTDRLAAIAETDAVTEPDAAAETHAATELVGQRAPTRDRAWRGRAARGLVAACLVGAGVLGTLGYQRTAGEPPDGPPGTLGAVEQIAFSGEPDDTVVRASLVAHTWGTETVLEVDGFTVGETFEVVLVSDSGKELSSGAFIGADATVSCRMNAAVMREDVAQVWIVSSDEHVRLVAELPAAT